jgi:NAD(P)-dependent dehydrogenase (short-subunit alcohol dehydrogenase family)
MDKAIVFGLGLIGQIVVKALKDLDYEVIGVDLSDKSNLIAHHDNLISTEVCDATDENVVEHILKQIFDKYQNPYLLVNALGVDVKVGDSNTFESLDNQNIQNFNKALLHGLTSYFVTSKHFVLNHLKNESLGRILNIASDLSVIAPDHRLYNQKDITNYKPAHYGVVKHGVVGLTKYFSATYAPQVITNSLSPSGILQDGMDKDFIKKLSERTPLNRLMEGHELAEPIKFLCNKDNSFATGQNLVVDGGRSII